MSDPKIITIGDIAFECPYWDLLPPLSSREVFELSDSIYNYGMKTPIVVLTISEGRYRVLDGYHRLSVALELELSEMDIPLQVDGDVGDYEPDYEEGLATELNLKRRHLSEEQKAEWIVKLRQKKKSLREIADAVGVSKDTVARTLSTVSNETVETLPATTKGKDGKERKAQLPPKPKADPDTRCQYDSLCQERRVPPARYCEAHLQQARRELAEATNPPTQAPLPLTLSAPQETLLPSPKETASLPSLVKEVLDEKTTERSSKEDRQAYTRQLDENRQAKHESIASSAKAKQRPGQVGPFSLLYVDPPWSHDAKISESKAVPYPTMTLEDLKLLPIHAICAPNCVMYLWVTVPHAEEAFELLKAWGFAYKSQHVWDKGGNGSGMGHWSRVDHELLYIATRGDFPTPPTAGRRSSVFNYEKGRHSEKPIEVQEYLENIYIKHPKAELFARRERSSWTCIGNEIDGRDIREVLANALPLETEQQRALPEMEAPSMSAERTEERQAEELSGERPGEGQETPQTLTPSEPASGLETETSTDTSPVTQEETPKDPWLVKALEKIAATKTTQANHGVKGTLLQSPRANTPEIVEAIKKAAVAQHQKLAALEKERARPKALLTDEDNPPILCLLCGEKPVNWIDMLVHYRRKHKHDSRGVSAQFSYGGQTWQTYSGTYTIFAFMRTFGLNDTLAILVDGEACDHTFWLKEQTTTQIGTAAKEDDNKPIESPLKKKTEKPTKKGFNRCDRCGEDYPDILNHVCKDVLAQTLPKKTPPKPSRKESAAKPKAKKKARR